MKNYCMYLRKFCADAEAELRGEGETLVRHEKLLLEVVKRGNYHVIKIYKELVSGETIAARPQMQKLLQEVESGFWNGVLVVEVERFARSDTIDQGIMAQAFKYSDTKIITPMKVYDPNNITEIMRVPILLLIHDISNNGASLLMGVRKHFLSTVSQFFSNNCTLQFHKSSKITQEIQSLLSH